MLNSRTFKLAQRHLFSFIRHNTARKFLNLCSTYYQLWTGQTTLTNFPFEIIIDPINICNLRCPLCVTGQQKNTRPNGIMPLVDFTKIIDELGQWLFKVRFYSWGEPLLHKNIYDMIFYCSFKNIGTEISTNFVNMRFDDFDRLIDSGLEYLVISLDGASESTYSKYRIGGDFDKVVDNIRILIQKKIVKKSHFPTVEIQFLVMKHNEHEIEDIKKLAQELGVDHLRLAPLTLNVREPEQIKKWLPIDEKLSRYDYDNFEDKVYRKRKRCEWLWRSTVINWDSTVSPCCVFEGPKSDIGVLNNGAFRNIWNNEVYRASRDVFNQKEITSRINTICARCKGNPRAADDKRDGLY